jgi:cell division protease FtsH
MVAHWGMSEKVGPVACHGSNEHPFLGRDVYEQREFSDHTARVIDDEVTRILGEAAIRATKLLSDNRDKLDRLAAALEDREMLDDTDLVGIVGPAAPRGREAARIPVFRTSPRRAQALVRRIPPGGRSSRTAPAEGRAQPGT